MVGKIFRIRYNIKIDIFWVGPPTGGIDLYGGRLYFENFKGGIRYHIGYDRMKRGHPGSVSLL